MVYNALIMGQFFECYKCIYFGTEEISYSANGDDWQVGRRRSFDCLNKKPRGSTGSFSRRPYRSSTTRTYKSHRRQGGTSM